MPYIVLTVVPFHIMVIVVLCLGLTVVPCYSVAIPYNFNSGTIPWFNSGSYHAIVLTDSGTMLAIVVNVWHDMYQCMSHYGMILMYVTLCLYIWHKTNAC